MNEEERICKVYDDLHGIKRTAAEVGVSWYRVVKILSTHGYILHEDAYRQECKDLYVEREGY